MRNRNKHYASFYINNCMLHKLSHEAMVEIKPIFKLNELSFIPNSFALDPEKLMKNYGEYYRNGVEIEMDDALAEKTECE